MHASRSRNPAQPHQTTRHLTLEPCSQFKKFLDFSGCWHRTRTFIRKRPPFMKAMDDYRLCVVCRGVTYESIRVPGGYKHFSDWRQLIEHDDPDKQCRLCEMIYEALAGRLLLEHAEFEKHMKAKAVSCSIRIFLPEPDIVHLYKTQSAIRSKESIYYPMTIRCGPCVIWAPALCKWKDYPETIEASLLLLPKYNRPHSIGVMSSSDECFQMIESWIQDCLSHKLCRRPMTKYSKYFPQRVIDVGTGDDSQVPRLILSTDLGNTEQRYITLSYCWGTSGNLVTTTSNLYERQSELAIDDMPKTLKDAISITRRLGVQFLWVDALCIFQGTDQDAVEDWQRQSAEMDQIYGNSFLTIAAGAATDVHQGIFRELKVSNKYFVLPMNNDRSLIFTTGHQPHKASSSQIEHLYTRSWAMQERMLSRRLVIYGEKHIFWQCSHRYCTEEGKSAGDNLNMRSLLQSKLDAYKTNRYLWRELVHNYSLSRATLETDKLPALSGLARTLQKHSEDEYLAGLWKNTIQMDLQWRLSRPPLQSKQPISRPKQYRAPSWTWASVDGDVEWPPTTSRAEVTLVDYKIEPSGLDKFGQISNGWIELDAMMVTLFCVIAKGNQYFLVWPREALLDHLPDSFGYLNIDGPYPPSSDSEFADWGEVTQTELFILRLDESEGIAMLPVNKLENTYRRIGILQFPRAWSSSDTGYEYPLWNWKNDVVRMI